MIETRGRKGREIFVDGSFHAVKKPIKLCNSLAVLLPKDWLEGVAMGRGGVGAIRYFVVDTSHDIFVTVKPCFEEPAGHEPASD